MNTPKAQAERDETPKVAPMSLVIDDAPLRARVEKYIKGERYKDSLTNAVAFLVHTALKAAGY